MNCANHPDVAAVAYCRTCGKPMCANCMRSVNGVIYCESCLAARIEGSVPPPPRSPLGLYRPRVAEVPTLLWPESLPDSFLTAWAPFTPANMPRA